METTPPVPQPEADPSAGFWIRAGAYMIDGLITAVAGALTFFLPNPLGYGARVLVSLAYLTVMPVLAGGQTVGKMAAGIAMIREDGQPLTYLTTFLRAIGYWVSTLTAGLGFFCVPFTPHNRGLHDYIAGTRVVYVEPVGAGRKALVILAGCVLPLIAVVGIIAAVAIPSFTSLAGKSLEAGTKGSLGSLRSAISIYYGDTDGQYPASVDALVPKYLPRVPPVNTKDRPNTEGVETYGAEACLTQPGQPGGNVDPSKLRDTGKWGYLYAPSSPCHGMLFVDSTHQDSRGTAWYSY